MTPNDRFAKYRREFGDIVKIIGRPGSLVGVHLFNPDDIEKVSPLLRNIKIYSLKYQRGI